MTVHLELPEEIERRVSQAAAQQNQPVETYLLTLVDSATPKLETQSPRIENFHSYLESLALFVGKTPNYPADFWTRDIVSDDDDDDYRLIR